MSESGNLKPCHACGVQKDPSVLEVYPFPDDCIITEEPIAPLFEIDCQPGGTGFGPGEWKVISLCHACFHRLLPDMWTCQDHYEALNPVTPYGELPNLEVENE